MYTLRVIRMYNLLNAIIVAAAAASAAVVMNLCSLGKAVCKEARKKFKLEGNEHVICLIQYTYDIC